MRKFGLECGLLVPESGLGTEYLELRLMGLAYDRCKVDDWRYAKSGSRLIRTSRILGFWLWRTLIQGAETSNVV